jgi:hypothetical protein
LIAMGRVSAAAHRLHRLRRKWNGATMRARAGAAGLRAGPAVADRLCAVEIGAIFRASKSLKRTTMLHRSFIAAVALAAALGAFTADARAFDDTRYPDLKGQWVRGYPGLARFDPAKGPGPRQEAPLTPEYQAIYQANLDEQAKGGQGIDPTYRCLSPGMPRVMHVYSPMEIG